MQIILIRHAKTLSNVSSTYMGGTDSPATAEGLEEAKKLRNVLDLPNFAACFSSPLSRAHNTLKAIGPCSDILLDDRLSERNLGAWEGMRKADVRQEFPNAFSTAGVFDPTFVPPQGETLEAFSARITGFLNDIREHTNGKVLIVTHNGWIRTMRYLLGEIAREDIFSEDEQHLSPIVMPIRRNVRIGAHV
jgi:broad specificity phosphatase PhoE